MYKVRQKRITWYKYVKQHKKLQKTAQKNIKKTSKKGQKCLKTDFKTSLFYGVFAASYDVFFIPKIPKNFQNTPPKNIRFLGKFFIGSCLSELICTPVNSQISTRALIDSPTSKGALIQGGGALIGGKAVRKFEIFYFCKLQKSCPKLKSLCKKPTINEQF